jgi:hypothetical protein
MAELHAALAASPELYPLALDPGRDSVFVIPMRAEDYRRASFLDERATTPAARGQWLRFADVARAMEAPQAVRPLHFIFHSGHVGSTLLSRLLDQTGMVLPLREPLPLRTLAAMHDAGAPGADLRLEVFLRLWERGFPDTQAVILKATSSAQRLGTQLMTLRPQAKAVTLNVRAESYLAIMLAAENSAVDLNAHGAERFHRLRKYLDAAPQPTTLGELAAMSWLVERLTQDDLRVAFGTRVLPVDFDALLEGLDAGLKLVTSHFALPVSAGETAITDYGDVLSRYSKAPSESYSPGLRAERLAEARSLFGAEIRAALSWLERLGHRHPRVAAIL